MARTVLLARQWITTAVTALLLTVLAGCGNRSEPPQTDRGIGGGPSKEQTAEEAAPAFRWTTSNVEALRLNARASAYIDQFDKGFPEAVVLLRKAIELAPDWLPPRINLAIALLNQPKKPGALDEAQEILREILQADPENVYAHFCLGIILNHLGQLDEAARHFEAVTRIDPENSYGWYWLGNCLMATDRSRAREAFQKAVELNPIFVPAIYGLAQLLMLSGQPDEAKKLLAQKKLLDEAKEGVQAKIMYDDMGPYANAIGRAAVDPLTSRSRPVLYEPWEELSVSLAEGTRWAGWKDLEGSDPLQLLGFARQRLGFPWATFDYDGDGDLDVFLAGAVVRDGQLGNLLLRNDGDGQFHDVTAEAGLAGGMLTLAIAIGDYDNDLDPDLYLCNIGANRLYRNDKGKFVDVTDEAGVAGGEQISTGAVFVDLDLDADLDLFVVNIGSVSQAASLLSGELPDHAPAKVFRNVGRPGVVAPAPKPGSSQKGPVILSTEFEELSEQGPSWQPPAAAVTFTDIDNDRDVDLVLLSADGRCVALYNDRLLRFTARPLQGAALAKAAAFATLLVWDWNEDDARDLIITDGSEQGAILIGQGRVPKVDYPVDPSKLTWKPVHEGVSLIQPRVLDFDLDGNWDAVALQDGKPVLLRADESGKLQVFGAALPAFLTADGQPLKAASLVASDLTGNGFAELVGFVPGHGLVGQKTEGNASNWVKIRFTGVRDDGLEMRTPADGTGIRVIVLAGDVYALTELRPTVGSGCATHEPLTFGLDGYSEVDGIRMRWPDNTLQAEVGLAANELHIIRQVRRKSVSCPLLFTWNGRRYEFITDFLGGGGLGYLLAPGVYNKPDPEELLLVRSDQLVPDQDVYRIAIAEPMDEVCYLDHVELLVIDHPSGTVVAPDERFAPEGFRATGELLLFRQLIQPKRAMTHRGQDVTAVLQRPDRRAVDQFHLRTVWPGYAEEHSVTMAFAVPRIDPDQRLFLCLHGWVEYAFSDTNYAAATAGITLTMPSIELRTEQGEWQTIVPVAGIPAGSPKLMTVELTGKVPTGREVELRVRTNVQVYWDAAWLAIADRDARETIRVTRLLPTKSRLFYKGHLTEYSPDGRWPTVFDYHRTDPAPLVRQFGYYTRYGDVTELLAKADDAFVIFGAGDALEIGFPAESVPELPDGWRRTYVVRTVGFCKSADPLTVCPLTVDPLPFRGMSSYPPKPGESPRNAEAVRRLHRKYNTRYHGPPGQISHR